MEDSDRAEPERLSPGFMEIKSEPMEYNVDIKMEPADEDSDSNQYNETCAFPNIEIVSIKTEKENESIPKMEGIIVKVEPTYYSSEDEFTLASNQASQEPLPPLQYHLRPVLKIPQIKKIRKAMKCDSDEDYVPKRKKKKDKKETVKKTYSTKAKKKENCYPANVTKHIELVTITEQERQVEFKELWQSRVHMRYKCQDCAVGFVMEGPYVVHMKVHSPESGDYECEICRSRVRSEERLYKHRLGHYRRYRCSLCKRILKDKETAASHVMSDHVHQVFSCEQCRKGFKRPAYLKKHIAQQHTKGEQHDCPICGRVFFDRSMFRTHFRRHNEEVRNPVTQLFICDHCCRQLKSKQALKRHLLVHARARHVPVTVTCGTCPAVFQTRRGLRLHELNKHTERERHLQPCPHCERSCTTPALLRQHIRRMHTDRTKKYQCDHCKRFYYTKGEVREHIIWAHAASRGERALFCCGREFRTRTRLKDHIAIHHLRVEKQRIHKCDQCEKAFANKQVLNRHKKSHANIFYPCPLCDVRFKCEAYVKVHHQLKHLNMTRAQIKAQKQSRRKVLPGCDKPEDLSVWVEKQRIHKCNQCKKAFANKQVLNRHKKSHANIFYPCPLCDVRFKCEAYVKVHHQLKHLNMTRAQIKAQKQSRRKVLPGCDKPEDLNVKKSENKEICFEKVIVKREVDSDSGVTGVRVPVFDLVDLKPV